MTENLCHAQLGSPQHKVVITFHHHRWDNYGESRVSSIMYSSKGRRKKNGGKEVEQGKNRTAAIKQHCYLVPALLLDFNVAPAACMMDH